jgi:hypothetical protein
LILYEKCLAEENIQLFLDTCITGAEVDSRKISTVYANRESTEQRFIFKASVYIDCTGDGRLGSEAGAEYTMGRESKQEYNESMAPVEGDKKVLGSSILFQAQDMGKPMPFTPPSWARKFTESDLQFRPHNYFNYGYWWLEYGGEIDTIKENDKIRYELLRIALGVWDHIKNSGNHDADNYALTWLGFLPGKRESRRFKGLFTFTQQDAMESPFFEDTIAFGGWPLDTHPPGGIDAKSEPGCEQPLPPNLYGIPLRCCISKNISNLMFAGRNISASHIGFSSLRVMATCGAIGQGIGAAAGESAFSDCQPSEILSSEELLQKVQNFLVKNDCFLPGIELTEENKADSAKLTASSEAEKGSVNNVLTPQTRSVHGTGGLRAELTEKGTHRWISKELPAWIELNWEKPVELSEIRLVFDTGMHRPLTLSADRSPKLFRDNMLWEPQPETGKEYTINYKNKGEWRELVKVENNYQRLKIHRVSKIRADCLRLNITAMNGLNQARVCAIQCF